MVWTKALRHGRHYDNSMEKYVEYDASQIKWPMEKIPTKKHVGWLCWFTTMSLSKDDTPRTWASVEYPISWYRADTSAAQQTVQGWQWHTSIPGKWGRMPVFIERCKATAITEHWLKWNSENRPYIRLNSCQRFVAYRQNWYFVSASSSLKFTSN